MTQMLDGDKLVKCIYIKKWSFKKKKKDEKTLMNSYREYREIFKTAQFLKIKYIDLATIFMGE